jgi:hypothetical protein
MIPRVTLGSMLLFFLTSPGLAGPCAQRIADLERTFGVAMQEGAPAPGTDASTPAKGATQDANEGMALLKQAKELDSQGKEQECMAVVAKVSTTKAPLTNK